VDRQDLTPAAAPPARPSGNFGKLSSGFLAVSLLSGAVLAAHYDPAAPLSSLESIAFGIPFGSFLRGLHAWSSYGLLLALVVHAVEVARKRTEGQLAAGVWWRAVALLPLLVLALLGGFVLRGDAEARAAADVWRGMTSSIPGAGPPLAALLLGGPGSGLGAAALHHAGTFSILLVILTVEHARVVWPGTRPSVLAALASVGAAGLLTVPLGPPPPGHGVLLGPWPLLGLQGMLVDLPAAAGWIVPLAGVLLLGSLRGAAGPARTAALAALAALAAGWAAFTLRILVLAGH